MTQLAHHVRALSALGHEARLEVFLLLVRAGHPGLTVGQIGGNAGLAPSTLAHHLRLLVEAGLVEQEKHGRETINRANFAELQRLTDFLNDECCVGVSDLHQDPAA